MKKELGVDSLGIQKTMYFKDYVFDAVGQFTANTITLLTAQMTYFYTEKVGVAAVVAGNILLISKILDAFTDLIMGKLLMNTKSKYGKARPWFLRMLFPTMVAIIALFTMPQLSETGMLIYGVITNVLVSAICYTAIMCAYNSLLAYKTQSPEEQGNMGVARTAVGYALGAGLGMGLIPITNALGGDQRAWIIFSVIMAVLAGLCMLIVFVTSKERYVETSDAAAAEDQVSIWESIKILLRNPYWIKITVAGVGMNIFYCLIMAAPLYYCTYVLRDEGFYSIINLCNLIPSAIGVVTTPMLLKKVGLTNGFRIGAVIAVVGELIRCFAPANAMVTLIFGCVVMYATVPMMSALMPMIVNTAEINMDKYGVRLVPMTNATASFVGKIGNGIGSASIGWVLAAFGFITGGTVDQQPASIIPGIYTLNIYIPLGAMAVCLLILARYDLDKRYESLLVSNAEKENARKPAK